MARHWTDQTDHEAAKVYASFSEAKIREYQDLAAIQIKVAYDRGLTDALHDLRRMENALAAEMMRRLDARG